MGRYRLGDIIRMTRKSLSITQEQLCEGICSTETLSRIENGNQNPSRDVYELIMERMGRIRERAYSMLSVSDFKILEMKRLFDEYGKYYDYNQAEKELLKIKDIIGNSTLDRQWLIRAESLVDYHLNRINTQEFLDSFEKAIRLTIPQYGSISLSNWPLSFNEASLLTNISVAYSELGNDQKAIEVSEESYQALKQSYVEDFQRVILQITLLCNLSNWYSSADDFEKSYQYAQEGIKLCRKYKLGNALSHLLYTLAWNKEHLIEVGVLSPELKRECLMDFMQAYYVASAIQATYMEQFILNHVKEKGYETDGFI